jgi:hypothetical protein
VKKEGPFSFRKGRKRRDEEMDSMDFQGKRIDT